MAEDRGVRAIARQHGSEIREQAGRNARHVAADRQHRGKALAMRMVERGGDPAQRAKAGVGAIGEARPRSEEHTSELQSLMRISYAVFCLKKTQSTLLPRTDRSQYHPVSLKHQSNHTDTNH